MSQESLKLMQDLNFCVIDLETTGGNLKYDKIIEIGIVKVKKLEIGKTKEILINPEIPIPQFVQRLTSISEDDIKTAPIIEDVIEEIIDFIGDDILVAHNTSFDIPFLNSVLKRLKKPLLKNKVLCTNVMTKYLIPEMMNSNLPHLCRVFNISHERAHRALSDARSTAKLLLHYISIFIEKDIRKINQLYYPRNKFELDHIHLKKDELSEEILTKVFESGHAFSFSFKGKEGVLLDFIPFDPVKMKREDLESILKSDWQRLTIKIIGHFFQGMVQFKDYYLNIPKENRERTLEMLRGKYSYTRQENFQWDFVITPHIVDDQYIIFSQKKLTYKSILIFKFPGHERKLEQYIKSQLNKTPKKKFSPHAEHNEVIALMNHYLNQAEDLKCLSKKNLPLNNPKYFEEYIRSCFKTKRKKYFPDFHF